MTFWDFLTKALEYLSSKWTRVLGLAIGTEAVLVATNIIPSGQLKYWLAANAVLVYWRGQSTGKTYVQAKAILSANTIPQPGAPAPSMETPK